MFIAFEGGEGAGKTSQIRLLDRHLSERGEQVLGTREPGGTSLGQQLRQLLLHTGTHDPRAEALMFAADRADHVGTVIQPALAAGAPNCCWESVL
jgi:dTMP kinase